MGMQMEQGRTVSEGLSIDILQSLARVTDLSLPPQMYRSEMEKLGTALVQSERRQIARQRKDDGIGKFHVVSSVDDFENLAAGVRTELKSFGDVSFSCLWTHLEQLSVEPRIDVCPIYQAYHDEVPDVPYALVFVAANIGSVIPMVAMMMQTIDRRKFSDFRQLWIMSPVIHQSARKNLIERTSHAAAADWAYLAIDTELKQNGTTFPGVGGLPEARVGFPNSSIRENYRPQAVIDQRTLRRNARLANSSPSAPSPRPR